MKKARINWNLNVEDAQEILEIIEVAGQIGTMEEALTKKIWARKLNRLINRAIAKNVLISKNTEESKI